MARKSYEELNKLKKKFGVSILWSWSRYHTYKTDHWEYLLKYIQHIKEDRDNGIYCVSGGSCHTIIERFYEKKIKYEDMIKEYEDSLLTMNIAELKYDRSDSDKNEKIANKYEDCIKHFFKNHQPIIQPHKIEHFIVIDIDGNIFQGYVDFLHIEKYKDDEGNEHKKVVITDWKTSTIYKGKKIDDECGQLLLYAEGVRQTLKIPLEDIVIRWAFLKYVTVQCLQANNKWKERQIERNSIGESLVSSIKMWLKKQEYTQEQIDEYVSDVILNNSLDKLPKEVQDKFVISDCYVEIPLTKEKIDDLKDDIKTTIKEINTNETEYNQLKETDKEQAEHIFWQDVTQADSYRLAVLSGYSRKVHKPYDEYLRQQEMFETKEQSQDEDDMSWLNDL